MLDTLIAAPQYIIPFLLILSVVVFVHEFGHYWVARRNGVRVETFSIGSDQNCSGATTRMEHGGSSASCPSAAT